MLAWLKRLFTRGRFRNRLLFRYHDGTRWRYGDPYKLWREMWNPTGAGHKCLLKEHAPAFDSGQEPETTLLIEAICKVFGLKRFDPESGEGVTDWEAKNILNVLSDYIDEVKKNTRASPTSPEPTASKPPFDSPAPQAEPTKPSSDSGSTPIGSNSVEPIPSEKPSDQPLTPASN
jgi:hypothetical protein